MKNRPPSAAVAPGSDPDLAISMDLPKILNGAAEDSVISSLSIAGWALARAGVKAINIAVDGKHLSTAHYGVRREDVASAFPARGDALMSGFAALDPELAAAQGLAPDVHFRRRFRGQVGLGGIRHPGRGDPGRRRPLVAAAEDRRIARSNCRRAS